MDCTEEKKEERLKKYEDKDVQVFIVCVAVDQADKEKFAEKWIDEIRAKNTKAPIVLVLTKNDLTVETKAPEASAAPAEDTTAPAATPQITKDILGEKATKTLCRDIVVTSAKNWSDASVTKAFERIAGLACEFFLKNFTPAPTPTLEAKDADKTDKSAAGTDATNADRPTAATDA